MCGRVGWHIDLERMELGRQFQPGTIIVPICDLNKRIVQKILIHVLGIRDREVEIFRKSVGLEEARLETCPALEDPGTRKLIMLADAV